jgi:hypothetical protein
MIAAMRSWRRRAFAWLLALPLLLLVLRSALGPVVEAAKADPVGESLIIVGVLAFTAVVLVRSVRRQLRRPSLPGQLWCSSPVLYPGPHDEDAAGFEGSPEFARSLMESEMVPVVWLVLTANQVLIVPSQGDDPPLTLNLSDVSTIRIITAGRRENGVSITRRDGREAAFLFRPDQKLVRELERLGATVVTADVTAS